MLKNLWLLLRLLICVLTIRYAVAMTRCMAEFAWTANPTSVFSASFNRRLETLESEDVRQLYAAVKKLITSYQQTIRELKNVGYEKIAEQDRWMASVDEAIGKEMFASDEGAKEEFDSAYRAYVDMVAEIVAEVRASEDKWTALYRNHDEHRLAVRNLLGKIPYRYSNTLDAWQATSSGKGEGYGSPLESHPGIPCEQVWARRFGDEKLAHALGIVAYIVWFVWLGSVILRTLELLTETYFVARLQGWVLGHLWSIYYDAPRHALLWLLRMIDPKLDSTPNRDTDFRLRVLVVEELRQPRPS